MSFKKFDPHMDTSTGIRVDVKAFKKSFVLKRKFESRIMSLRKVQSKNQLLFKHEKFRLKGQ